MIFKSLFKYVIGFTIVFCIILRISMPNASVSAPDNIKNKLTVQTPSHVRSSKAVASERNGSQIDHEMEIEEAH